MVLVSASRAGEGCGWLSKYASGFFTGLQFVAATAQAALFIYQLRLICVSLEDAKVVSAAATRQARVAEDTLTKIERPYVFVYNVSSLKIDHWEYEGETGATLSVKYSVGNYGKVPAVIEHMQVKPERARLAAAPTNYDYNHPLAVSAVRVPGEPRNDLYEGL